MPLPSPQDQVQFLLNVQRLLTEGQFTATYKYALLLYGGSHCVKVGATTPATNCPSPPPNLPRSSSKPTGVRAFRSPAPAAAKYSSKIPIAKRPSSITSPKPDA